VSTGEGPAPGSAELLARAGWLDLLDDIHGGLCHDFNCRVASVGGLLQLLEMGAADVLGTLSYLGPETERLEELARQLGSLSGGVDASAEAFELAELAACAVSLLARHRPLASVTVPLPSGGGVAPVRASRPRVLRVLLLVLGHAAQAARAAGVGSLSASLSQTQGRVALRIGWEGDAARWDPGSLGGAAEPLDRLLALDGGRLEVEEGAVALVLPALGAG